MYSTIEVRWFLEGSIPSEITEWFATMSQEMPLIEERTDRYFCTGSEDMSIKLRDGFIEIKERQKELGVQDLGPYTSGLVDTWTKWSFKLDAGTDYEQMVGASQKWLDIHKRRLLLIVPEAEGHAGYQLELSGITIGDQHWWSFGLEGTGQGREAESAFVRKSQLIRFPKREFFMGKYSMAYPQFVEMILQREHRER